MPFAPHENSQIEYSAVGKGKGLVLVHGTGQSAENTWTEVAEHFAPSRTVVCPNYSGSGRTRDDGGELTVGLLAEQVLAAADHAGLERFAVVGHSLGTCVAMHLAANHPDRVDEVALLAGFASAEDARLRLMLGMWKEMVGKNPRLLAQTFLFTAFSPAFVSGLGDRAVRDTVDAMFSATDWKGAERQIDLDLRVDVTQEAMRMRQKTLVIGCLFDYILPIAHSKKLVELIPNARYAEMTTGHAGCVENCAQFIEILEEFLA